MASFFWISRALFICLLCLLYFVLKYFYSFLLHITVTLTGICVESAMCRYYKQITRDTRLVTFHSQVSKKNILYVHWKANSCASFFFSFIFYIYFQLIEQHIENLNSSILLICAISKNLTNNADLLVNELLVIGNTTGHNYWLLLSYSVLW